MIMFINRLICIFRGPPISLASITRIKPHHVRCAQGKSVHYNMLAKTLKKENENFSKQNFISKFQLLSDKIVLTSPPPVSADTAAAPVVISAGPVSRVRAYTCSDTCPPARLSLHLGQQRARVAPLPRPDPAQASVTPTASAPWSGLRLPSSPPVPSTSPFPHSRVGMPSSLSSLSPTTPQAAPSCLLRIRRSI